jgi:hypothetical protein
MFMQAGVSDDASRRKLCSRPARHSENILFALKRGVCGWRRGV